MIQLNLGAGNFNPPGFQPIDRQDGQEAYPLGRPDNSVDVIRASHILEHFSHQEVQLVVNDWVRALKPGGVLKIAVPNFDWIVDRYKEGRGDLPLHSFLMGGQVDENDFHKCLFTEASLYHYLKEAGLTDIEHWESELEDNASWAVSLNLQGTKPTAKPSNRYKPECNWLERQAANIYSQHGEDGILKAIFDRLNRAGEAYWGYCVDVGAADGLLFSNVRQFIDIGWHGLLIEADEKRFQALVANSTKPGVKCFNYEVVPTGRRSLDNLLDEAGAREKIDLLSIDIDGQDYYVWNSLVRYKPLVVVCEYDPNADKAHIPALGAPSSGMNLNQAGYQAISYVAAGKGYTVVAKTVTNIIAVRNELIPQLLEEVDGAATDAYRTQKPIIGSVGGSPVHQSSEVSNGADEPASRNGDRSVGNGGDPVATPTIGVADWGYTTGPSDRRRDLFVESSDGHHDVSAADGVQRAASNPSRPGRQSHSASQASLDDDHLPRIVAVASVPRLGFNATWHCTIKALQALNIPMSMVEGAYWEQCLTRGIENALSQGAEYVLTLDYDTIFDLQHVWRLCQLAIENPGVDAFVPVQMRRESDTALFLQNGDRDFTKPLTKIASGHFGLTLFRADVFAKLPKPWLFSRPDKQGGWGPGHVDADMHFWGQFNRVGLTACLCNEVRVGHLQISASWPDANMKPVHQLIGEFRANGQPKECGGGLKVESGLSMLPEDERAELLERMGVR